MNDSAIRLPDNIMGLDPPEDDLADIDLDAERRLVRKLDRHIMPLVMANLLLCCLDRTNIGNARLFGLETDLRLHGDQFNSALAAYFLTFVLVEVPSNLLLQRWTPSRYFAVLTFSWGLITAMMGVVSSFGGLVACRMLLGVFEGGLFPGLTVYLTLFYTKQELSLRVALLFASSASAGACGGLLAVAISFMDGTLGMSAWRWIFILEGIPTALFAAVVWFCLADCPERAWYLDTDESRRLLARLHRQTGFTDTLTSRDVWLAVRDWKVWLFATAQFGCHAMLYSYALFLPSILWVLGTWNTLQVQALTIPCYVLGTAAYLAVAWLADRKQVRGPLQVAGSLVCLAGYVHAVTRRDHHLSHYTGMLLVGLGLFVAVGLPLSWLPCNVPRYGKRTMALGLQWTLSNMSGLLAPWLYPARDEPDFTMGYCVSIGLLVYSMAMFGFISFYFGQTNRRRRGYRENHKIVGLTDAEVDAMGEDSPRFIYSI